MTRPRLFPAFLPVPPVLSGVPSVLLAAVLRASLALCWLAPRAQAAAAPEILLETNVPVTMRDGVVLRADVRRPAGPGPFPALICRTPYGKTTDPDELRFARRAVARGYAVILQDVRGRYASAGNFDPHRNEGRDGYDSIEWAAAQSWCDGRVGTFGLSYAGSTQWFAALEAPPHLLGPGPGHELRQPAERHLEPGRAGHGLVALGPGAHRPGHARPRQPARAKEPRAKPGPSGSSAARPSSPTCRS